MSQTLNQGSPYVLSRYKSYYEVSQAESKQAIHHRNNRFSLVDDVLDIEYNDFPAFVPEIAGKINTAKTVSPIAQLGASLLFRGLLYFRLVTYYIIHFRYRPI